ncbi:MAG: hypothetical protein ACQZ3M_04115 [cyanobacterium endosymbiont of Rhopalodia fuxianensis]
MTEAAISLEPIIANLRGGIHQTKVMIPDDFFLTTMADHPQLIQLFLNLISNAFKFLSEKTTKIYNLSQELEHY